MTNPWAHVEADDDLAADLLAGTVELVLEAGGWIHPEARFRARAGEIGVWCAAELGEPLLHLPSEAFLRIGRASWSASGERLEFTDPPADVGGLEHELLILQTALHNACDKIPQLVATHPVLAPDLDDPVIDAVRAFRPSFRRRQPTPAGLFWSDRTFRLPAHEGAAPEPMALPLVDLLNHAQGGATGSWTGETFDVRAARGPGGECVLDYGLERDAIGMAVVYGFVDHTCQVAHSAPLDVEVPSMGPVRVLARGRTRAGALLPPVVTETSSGTEISHLTYRPGGGAALARRLEKASALTSGQCAAIVHAVAAANLDLLGRLVGAIDAAPRSAAGAVLRGAARRQSDVITSS
ncbi:MAG: hypothetical protein GC156_11495 [Actinomycetales bacterium]|nr:hypothetical protein [Actinomycetales bacterium]